MSLVIPGVNGSYEPVREAGSKAVYAMSPGGVTFRSKLANGLIEIAWARRFRRAMTKTFVKDLNGMESLVQNPSNMPDAWCVCGLIDFESVSLALRGPFIRVSLDDESVAMRWPVQLLAAGFGEEPSDIIRMFDSPSLGDWLVQGTYNVVSPIGRIGELGWKSVTVSRGEDGSVSASSSVAGSTYELDTDAPFISEAWFSLAISH